MKQEETRVTYQQNRPEQATAQTSPTNQTTDPVTRPTFSIQPKILV
jgi:hypothetical protein